MHIKSELMQVSKARFFAQLASTLLINCRQELEETAQESVNRDYHQGKEALGKILTEEQKAALEKDFEFGDGSDKFTGTFSEFITGYTNTLGTDKKTNDSRLKASLAIAESVESDRMGVSGVSLNEEGINMMTYNKAYSALGRLMTTMDEQLDMIINQMGLVGR